MSLCSYREDYDEEDNPNVAALPSTETVLLEQSSHFSTNHAPLSETSPIEKNE